MAISYTTMQWQITRGVLSGTITAASGTTITCSALTTTHRSSTGLTKTLRFARHDFVVGQVIRVSGMGSNYNTSSSVVSSVTATDITYPGSTGNTESLTADTSGRVSLSNSIAYPANSDLTSRLMWITSGTGAGQVRRIADVTDTGFILATPFTVQPTNGSTYVINHNFFDVWNAETTHTYCVRAGSAYAFKYQPCRIEISDDGAYYSFFGDTNKYIDMQYYSGSWHNIGTTGATTRSLIQFGELVDATAKTGTQGCIFLLGDAISFPNVRSYDSAYKAIRQIAIVDFTGSSVQFYGCTVDGSVNISNASADVYNSIFKFCTFLTLPLTAYTDKENKFISVSGVLKSPGQYTNVYCRSSSIGVTPESGGDILAVDANFDSWSVLASQALQSDWFKRCWSLRYTVSDELSGVRFLIVDKDSNLIINDTTTAGVLPVAIMFDWAVYCTGHIETNEENEDPDLWFDYYVSDGFGPVETQNPLMMKVRAYGYQFIALEKTITGKVTEGITLTLNTFIVAPDADTAIGYSGISVNGSDKTITLSANRSMQELYDYCQAWACVSGDMGYDEPFSTSNGNNFVSPYALIINSGVTLSGSGKTCDLRDGATWKSLTLSGTSEVVFTYYDGSGDPTDNANSTSNSPPVMLTISGMAEGSRWRVAYANGSEMTNGYGVADSGGTASFEYTPSPSTTVYLTVRKASTAPKYLPYTAQNTLNNGGVSFVVSQILDPIA